MPELRPGLCSVTFRALPPEDIIRLAAACGLAGIEWGADVHLPPGDLRAAGAVRQACADAGVACPSYGSYLAAGALGDADVRAVLDTAAALGATNVRVWSAWTEVAATAEDRRRQIADDLASVAAAAEPLGLTVSTEFHAHTLTETAASTVALLREAGTPTNLFTYWQPMDALGPEALLAELEAVVADLSHLHVFRWTPRARRLPLAEGADVWPASFASVRGRAADDSRWRDDRYAFLEFVLDDAPTQLEADAATLRGWLSNRYS